MKSNVAYWSELTLVCSQFSNKVFYTRSVPLDCSPSRSPCHKSFRNTLFPRSRWYWWVFSIADTAGRSFILSLAVKSAVNLLLVEWCLKLLNFNDQIHQSQKKSPFHLPSQFAKSYLSALYTWSRCRLRSLKSINQLNK